MADQKVLIARQFKAFQPGVLHHRVEALTSDSCISQLKQKLILTFTIFISNTDEPAGFGRQGSAQGHFPCHHLGRAGRCHFLSYNHKTLYIYGLG